MSGYDPIQLMFAGMKKLGPGGDAHTLNVLRLLPQPAGPVIVDAGCGTGRQTLALARELGILIHAVDTYEPFLKELQARAAKAGVERLVQVHCMDMKDIPIVFPEIDLLWSEGAAYNIGFPNALKVWASAVKPGGFASVSEMCWLKDHPPSEVREFFRSEYPDMKSVGQNIGAVEEAGYVLLGTYMLPRDTWVDGYYDVLETRAKTLLHDPDPSVRDLATLMLEEIRVFNISENSYGYIFFVLQRC